MVFGVWKKEAETGEKAQRRREMEALIEDAKWNMYAELWDTAATQLERAKSLATLLRNKSKIDEILGLLEKCKMREKVEL